MKKILIVLVLFYLLVGCNVLNREKKFNIWKEFALEYNSYIKNNCKQRADICESDFEFGNLAVNNFEFSRFRKNIVESCMNIKNGDFLIMEKSGSGEVYYYFMYIFDLSNQKMNRIYKYSLNKNSVKLSDNNFRLEANSIKFMQELDYVKLNDSINWGDSPKTLGINFVSYTSIKNGRIEFVKFIPRPVAAAELQF